MRGMPVPMVSVTSETLGAFQKVYINTRALRGRVGCWLIAVGHRLLSSHKQSRNKEKKKLDILTAKIKLAPRNSMPLISRK